MKEKFLRETKSMSLSMNFENEVTMCVLVWTHCPPKACMGLFHRVQSQSQSQYGTDINNKNDDG